VSHELVGRRHSLLLRTRALNLGASDLGRVLSIRRAARDPPVLFTRLASQVGVEMAKTGRSMSQTVGSQVDSATSGVTDAGYEFASAAKEHAKTFTSTL
jgi:hypothetical protein